jgi:hypothetical protein
MPGMPQDVFVNQIERVGTDAGLAPPQAAVIFGPAFTVVDQPNVLVTGPRGESIDGVTRVDLTGFAFGTQTPPQAQVDVGTAASAALAPVTLAQVTVPLNKAVTIQLHVSVSILIPALGAFLWSKWGGVLAVINGGTTFGFDSNNDAAETFMGAPFGVSGQIGGLATSTSGLVQTVTLAPIDLATAYTGTTMPSGAWAASKSVNGTVQGSGTALGIGTNNTVLAAGGHWYFYTAGTTNGSGSGPTHTSGSASDGSATAYFGGTVAAGVPMTVTVTWRQVETGT